jgi:hypothetical protein
MFDVLIKSSLKATAKVCFNVQIFPRIDVEYMLLYNEQISEYYCCCKIRRFIVQLG